MKNKFLKYFLLAAGLMVTAPLSARANEAVASYWSESAAPVFYGATEITVPVGTEFDFDDTRFKIFARDFEDGDVTVNIEREGTVDTANVGTQEINYIVRDSHNNESRITVPVNVVDTQTEVEVVRTLFTNPSVWNMAEAGTNRGNNHDSQHLGVYVPQGQSIQVKINKSDRNLSLKFYGNDSHQESGYTIKNNGAWQTFTNLNNNVSYDSVPFIMTPVMDQGTALDETLEVSVKYNNEVKELNLYLQGEDDEQMFKDEWKADGDSFAIFENEVMTVLMPIIDVDRLTNYHTKGFTSLEQFGDYWIKVVDKMDEYLGLEMNPENPVHQDVPTKFFVKANRHGAGSAYYSGTHVGINSQHIHPFFEMNWGGLHEFAHGYQGSFGKGVMGLGEVSNNIFGRYIQTNKDIYFHEGDWLGNFSTKEDAFHSKRLAGKSWDEQGVDVRLYMICNLLDAFEGGDSYREISRWYREKLQQDVTMTNTDAYVASIADIYNVNIIPYMEAWGLTVGEDVRQSVNSRKLPILNILGDMVQGENLSNIMASINTNEKYELVTSDVLNSVEATVSVQMDGVELNDIQGKELKFYDGATLVKSVNVDANPMVVSLPVGSYSVAAPVQDGIFADAEYAYIKEGNNTLNINYTSYEDVTYDLSKTIKISGVHGTYGYNLAFNKEYTQATLTYGGANIGNASPSVKIYNAQGELVRQDDVTKDSSGAFYFNFNAGTQVLDITEGYKIEITNQHPNRVHVFSNINGGEITALKPGATVTTYVVTADGIKMEGMTDEEIREINYNLLKPELIKTVEAYKEIATAEELNNLTDNRIVKDKVLVAYLNLKETDRYEYDELATRIKEGAFEAATKLNILGIHGTVGTEIQFNEGNTRAFIKNGYADMGSVQPYFRIYDENGNQVTEELVTNSGAQDYFNFDKEAYEVFLRPGYVIEVNGQTKTRIVWKDYDTNDIISELAADAATAYYEVTAEGIVKQVRE